MDYLFISVRRFLIMCLFMRRGEEGEKKHNLMAVCPAGNTVRPPEGGKSSFFFLSFYTEILSSVLFFHFLRGAFNMVRK